MTIKRFKNTNMYMATLGKRFALGGTFSEAINRLMGKIIK